ncbi:hypothetical protein CPT_Shemara_077 [Salmonella phage Shemara]|uniref:Uncharacterized protein n=1 Tax=Salmonella phage Shemara TaxID=2596714 RepID=A0A5B8RMY9_9CAUD|nr:hypothetical protein PF624_gp77 [Salmonella phage Shemara]QEA10406.1 hypothetical protein CPT_Shemara_077 [Salmonella phage Shemara]
MSAVVDVVTFGLACFSLGIAVTLLIVERRK